MNVSSFFEHWGVDENPFRAEEARQDAVFDRLGVGPTTHPDFEKILGDLRHVSTSIVFGEKGSGKTALRIQLARRVAEHNALHEQERVFLVPYDDLNPILDRFYEHISGGPVPAPNRKQRAKKTTDQEAELLKRLKKLRLVDHMDAILHIATRRLVDALLGESTEVDGINAGPDLARKLRHADSRVRRDMMVLQSLYDASIDAPERTRRLRRRIGAPGDSGAFLWKAAAWAGWIIPLAVLGLWLYLGRQSADWPWLWILVGAIAFWGLFVFKRAVVDRLAMRRLARRLSRELRVIPRSVPSLADSLA
ncbi:MAG: hypothetical protein VYC34_07990, partial [Planctomycetota bacterium]|nr:hypothetical protein [Planctomycetota bacterium]